MIEIERYLVLYDKFSLSKPLETPLEATLEEISEALYCTTRNVKLILKKLEEEGLVNWLPGRGRGHRSRLVFREPKEALLLRVCQEEVNHGRHQQAFDLLNRFGNESAVKAEFLEWLGRSFGVSQKTVEGKAGCDTFRLPVHRNVYTLDPAQVEYAFDSHLLHHIFDRLVAYDEASQRIVPGLAHSWSVNPEGTEWIFHLRKGVHFHNGKELTSYDVLFTLKRLQQAQSPNAWLLRNVAAIEAPGPRSIHIRLEKPNRIFDRFLSSSITSILPADFGDQDESSFWQHPIGTGSFRMQSLSPQQIVLTANESYYAERPYLDRVEILILGIEIGQHSTIGVPEVMTMSSDSESHSPEDNWHSLARLYNGCTMLTWNGQREGWGRNDYLRKAVRLMMDPIMMLGELGGERAMPAYRLHPDDSVNSMPRTVPQAEVMGLIAQSGYDGTPLKLLAQENFRQDLEWIASRMQAFGIQTELILADWREIVGKSILEEADLAFSGVFLSDKFVCEIDLYEHNGGIVSQYIEPEKGWILERIDAALASFSDEERITHLRAIELRLLEESRIIFLHHRRLNTFVHPSIRGASFNARGWLDFNQIWLEER